MIKVKCRGYEGDLTRLDSDIVQTKSLHGDTLKLATYDIEIDISDTESVTLREVKACEIEFA